MDLRASSHDRSRIYTLLYEEFENVIGISHINDGFGSYDKLYFLWTPKAGVKEWSYPSVDLSYFDENSTHIWRVNNDIDLINDCSVAKKNIFPLVWRPFGEIWLAVSFVCIFEPEKCLVNGYFPGTTGTFGHLRTTSMDRDDQVVLCNELFP